MEIVPAKIVFVVLGSILLLISVLPLVRNDNWIFRIFEYPRSQKLILNLILFTGFLFFIDLNSMWEIVFASLMLANIGYLTYQIWPYTIFSKHQIQKTAQIDGERQFKLFIANVYQENRDVKSCLKSIAENDPDTILLVETDQWWKNELDKELLKRYPFQIAKAISNTYGMVLYSRLKLIDPCIKFLIEKDIPSIHTKVMLPSGEIFKLYGLHPKPPVPHETARSTERDAEILLVAKEAKESKLPVVVAGDLNDVAWSYTTELFLKVSRLLDPRRGRGFFNTFNAHYWYLRWPLDHVFCSKHFHLTTLKRLPPIGSDHFPILICLALAGERAAENEGEMLKANTEEEAVATEKVRSGMAAH